MKSSSLQLENRGFVPSGAEKAFEILGGKELKTLLTSPIAVQRTITARLIKAGKRVEMVDALCQALLVEKKLYTKIEICESLSSFGIDALPYLIPMLGCIGNNQHKAIHPEKLKKKSFPLPRDIVARTIIRIGAPAVPFLLKTIGNNNFKQTCEAIDALGYICFYNAVTGCYNELILCYQTWKDNDLMVWKIVRAMRAFDESESFLKKLYSNTQNQGIIMEITSSLEIIKNQK